MNLKIRIYSFFHNVFQFFLLPVLSWQGKILRERALKLPEALGARNGIEGCGTAKLRVLIIGDSSACGVGVQYINHSLAGHLVKLLSKSHQCIWKIIAKSGLRTSDLVRLLYVQNINKFDIAVVSIGVNDITSGLSCEKWNRELIKLNTLLRTKFEVKKIIFSGMPPFGRLKIIPNPLRLTLYLKANLFEKLLFNFCQEDPTYEYVRINLPLGEEMIAEDGFHPSNHFYKFWASLVCKKILEN
tara:strand:- start:534 stop:1262 length:729 start_codon:yes stop_codon:yes gene_type:complete